MNHDSPVKEPGRSASVVGDQLEFCSVGSVVNTKINTVGLKSWPRVVFLTPPVVNITVFYSISAVPQEANEPEYDKR